MGSGAVIVLFGFVIQAHGRGLEANHSVEAQDSTDELVDKLAARLVDQTASLWPLQHVGLDDAMLEKPGTLKATLPASRLSGLPTLRTPGLLGLRSPSLSSHALRSSWPRSQVFSQPRVFASEEAAPATEPAPAPAPPPPPPAPVWDFSATDIRVGTIVEAWEHPDSEKLFCELIDVGEEEPRQIVSGLRAHYKLEDMNAGVRCLVVCNLKKAKLAGVESNGMVLCGGDADGKVQFVNPPSNASIGERVFCEGMEGEPESPNKVKKKKIWEAVQPDLKMVDGVATFKGVPVMTSDGPCKSGIVEGTIS